MLLTDTLNVLITPEYNGNVEHALNNLTLVCTTKPDAFGVNDDSRSGDIHIEDQVDDTSTLMYRKSPLFRYICVMNRIFFVKHGILNPGKEECEKETLCGSVSFYVHAR